MIGRFTERSYSSPLPIFDPLILISWWIRVGSTPQVKGGNIVGTWGDEVVVITEGINDACGRIWGIRSKHVGL